MMLFGPGVKAAEKTNNKKEADISKVTSVKITGLEHINRLFARNPIFR